MTAPNLPPSLRVEVAQGESAGHYLVTVHDLTADLEAGPRGGNNNRELDAMDDRVLAVAALFEAAIPMYEALKAIADYETPYHHETDEEHAEWIACAECTRRREDKYFPTNWCNYHYRSIVMKYEGLNNDERRYHTSQNMRDFARAAIALAERTAIGQNVDVRA